MKVKLVNRLLLALLVVIIVVVAGLSLFFIPTQNQTTSNQSVIQNGIETNSQTEHPVISGQEAKLISINMITEPGAYPGNPTLYKMPSGQLIWKIPTISNHTVIGYVYVDANTGKVIS